MKNCLERLFNGIIKENPTFVLMLGMCPTLAVTSSAINGFGMGISTMVVLAMSNLIISLLRKIIPDKVRIPAFIVIVATFVTIVELLMHAFVPSLYKSLGIYISLIVVNCIILGRAEAYASKNKPMPSLFDGIGMGLGFTGALTIIGFVRELLGSGKVFGFSAEDMFGTSIAQSLADFATSIFPEGSKIGEFFAQELGSFSPIGILVMAPGAFFILASLTAIQNKIKMDLQAKGKDASKIQSGCNCDCMNCNDLGCTKRENTSVETKESKQEEFHAKVQTEEDLDSREVLKDITVVEITDDEPEVNQTAVETSEISAKEEVVKAAVEEEPAEVIAAPEKPTRKRTAKVKKVEESIAESTEETNEDKPAPEKPARKRTTKAKTVEKSAEEKETKEKSSKEKSTEEKPTRKRTTKAKIAEEPIEEKSPNDSKEQEKPAAKKPGRKKATVTKETKKEENADE